MLSFFIALVAPLEMARIVDISADPGETSLPRAI